jgi:uncharacterized membrane protein YphA (DoxX/SURF4 family)
MQMKATLYIVLLVLSGMVAMLFLYGAVYTIANHYLYFAPNKIAAEFEASVIFAGGYLLVALTAATVFLVLLRRFKRMKPA